MAMNPRNGEGPGSIPGRVTIFRDVAQLVRAFGLGPRGPELESLLPDQFARICELLLSRGLV